MRCVRDGTAGPGLVTVEAERWLQGVSWKEPSKIVCLNLSLFLPLLSMFGIVLNEWLF